SEVPADRTRHYTIWLGGARVGTATESEDWSRQGVRLRRDEKLHFLRGDTEVSLITTIIIDADPALVARGVRWTESSASHPAADRHAPISGNERGAEATRGRDGWQLSTGGTIDPDAVPAELVPLLVRRDG